MINILINGIQAAMNHSSIISLLAGSSVNSIYYGQASKGAAKPYIIYMHAAGGDDHLTPQPSGDATFYIHAVDKSPTKAAQIADAIRSRLHEHEENFSLQSPWVMYRSQADAIIAYPETIDSVEFWHMGNVYRFRLTQ